MRIKAKYFSQDFREIYNLNQKINSDGYIYCVIQKEMYVLKQAAILAYKQLVNNLKKKTDMNQLKEQLGCGLIKIGQQNLHYVWTTLELNIFRKMTQNI